MEKITRNCYSSDSIDVKQLILLIYYLYTRGKNIIFCQLRKIANLASLFRQRTFIAFLVRLFLRGKRRTRILFYLIDLWPVSIPTYMQNFKIICRGGVSKIYKPLSLCIKTLKNITLGKDEKWIFSNFKYLQLI